MLMTNYLKMPKKSQVFALLELAGVTAYRSRDRRASRDGLAVRPDTPGKCGQKFPGSGPVAAD